MKQTLLAVLLFAISQVAIADERQSAVDIGANAIVINVSSLDLPESTTAYDVLSLLPDLVERTKSFVLENYDILINGMTVGNARDAVLQQIRVTDLRSVTVSNSSLSSVTSLGQGGVISLDLKPTQKGLTGEVNAEASTVAGFSGGFRLDNNNGKWIVNGLATVAGYYPKDKTKNSSTGLSSVSGMRDFSEVAAAMISYKPSAKDFLTINISELYTNHRNTENGYLSDILTREISKHVRRVNTYLGFGYKHKFSPLTNLGLELNYRFIPEKYKGYDSENIDNSYEHFTHNISGKLNLVQSLFTPTATRSANIAIGSQYSIYVGDNDNEATSLQYEGARPKHSDIFENTYYVRPYIVFNAKLNKWRFYANADYQHFSYRTRLKNEEDNASAHHSDNVTGQAAVIYNPDSRNLIRLRYIRSINRPGSTKLFPYVFYDVTAGKNRRGNPDLNPMQQNAIDLDYHLDLSNSDYHLEVKAGMEYSHTYDLIVNAPFNPMYPQSYTNCGKSDVILGNLGLYFRKNRLSVWFSGNIYNKNDDVDEQGTTDHYTYYNLLLRPVFNFGRGWMMSLSTTYNSSIKTKTYKYGDICYGNLRVGKKWNNLNAYLFGTLNLLGKMKDVAYDTSATDLVSSTSESEYMHSSIGAGIRYNF